MAASPITPAFRPVFPRENLDVSRFNGFHSRSGPLFTHVIDMRQKPLKRLG
jgi:hypothetical protein